MERKELFPAALFTFFVFCILTQDIALQQYFGTIAKTPVFFVAPVMFIFLIIIQKRVFLNTIVKYYFLYAMLGIVLSIFMLCYTLLFVTGGDMHVYDEFMPIKLVKAGFYNITYFIALYNLFVLARYLSLNTLLLLLQALLWFLIIDGFLQLSIGFKIPFINYSQLEGKRISLTASEPSNAAPMFLTLAAVVIALRIQLNKSKFGTAILGVLCFTILILINSKGFLILIPVAIIISIRKSLNFKVVTAASLFIVPFLLVIVYRVVPLLVADIQDFNSFSTRATTFVAALKSLYKYPVGEGYGSYLLYYPPMLLPTNNQIANFLGFPLLSMELTDMVQSGRNLPAKSGIANEIIYNGVFAIVFLVMLCRYYTSRIKLIVNKVVKHIFAFMGVLLLMVFLFNSVLETAYFYLLLVVITCKLADNNNVMPV